MVASVVARDRDTDARLRAAGWLPLRVWEHEDPVAAVDRIVATQRLLRAVRSTRRRPVDGARRR